MAESKKTEKLRLISADGRDVSVEKAAAMKMGMLKEIIEGDGEEIIEGDGKDNSTRIRIFDFCAEVPIVLNVEADVLEYVIEYCTEHVRGDLSEEDMKRWDADFLDVDSDTLYELILAANYLNIEDLLELTCGYAADMIKGKTVEEIRESFGIENDFTEDEEEEIRKENEWQIVE